METSYSEQPVLIGQTGPLNGQRWVIERSVTLGRESMCDIVIPDRQVSRYHARLTISEKGVTLEDLGSKNGTYCNGKMIQELIYLKDGDVLQIALVQQIVFLSSDSTMPLDNRMAVLERTGRLYLDPRSRRVWVGETEVLPPLSVPQFSLLQSLYNNQGKVVKRQDLIRAVWNDEDAVGVSEQALDALVRRLRDRLVDLDPDNAYIITVRGHGLRLDNPEE
ncbi:MAG: FHA domain-containing protein [Anaerolineaceae bacterium]|nr:FHA domain-containing protein [Anaerolineaceae bacterium]